MLASNQNERALQIAVVAVCSLFMLWLSIANGFPLLFPDSRSYFVAGRVALEKAVSIISESFGPSGDVQHSGGFEADLRKAVGVRSAYYGVFAYALTMIQSVWLVMVAHTILASYAINVYLREACNAAPIFRAATILILIFFSSLPWTTNYFMPDVFSALAILIFSLIVFYRGQLSSVQLTFLTILYIASLSFHMSNFMVAICMLLVFALLCILYKNLKPFLLQGIALVGVSIALAAAANFLVGLVGFGQLTMMPQSPPVLLARSLEDGPARAYLEKNCDRLDFAICQYADQLPDKSQVFLWDPEGIFLGSPLEYRDRLRREEMQIVVAAFLEHPFWQIQASLRNWLKQLVMFGLDNFFIGQRATITKDDFRVYDSGADPLLIALRSGLSWIIYVSVVACLGILVFRAGISPGAIEPRMRATIWVMLAGMILNAAICGMLSEPQSRYQARVIWLVPLAAIGILLPRTQRPVDAVRLP